MALQQLAKDTCIVRNTAGHKGRTLAVEPGAASRPGTFSLPKGTARILLDAGPDARPSRFDMPAPSFSPPPAPSPKKRG